MKNLGVYSALVDITANNNNDKKTVIFEESGETGSGEIIWEKKHLSNLQFFHELIKAELEETDDGQFKNSLETILRTEQCTSAYSLVFLKWIEEIAKILEKKDQIHFSIKDNHPLRIEINFTKLGDTSLLYHLAPRDLVNTIEEDEDFDDF